MRKKKGLKTLKKYPWKRFFSRDNKNLSNYILWLWNSIEIVINNSLSMSLWTIVRRFIYCTYIWSSRSLYVLLFLSHVIDVLVIDEATRPPTFTPLIKPYYVAVSASQAIKSIQYSRCRDKLKYEQEFFSPWRFISLTHRIRSMDEMSSMESTDAMRHNT